MRELAWDTINQVLINKKHSNKQINEKINQLASKQDRALFTNLTYGVIQNKIYLEFLVENYIKAKINSKLKNLILMSVYQIEFLDKVPNYAVVNEAVELTKRHYGQKLGSTINAILNEYLRNDQRSLSEIADEKERLAIEYSFPVWIVKMLSKQYPEEWQKIIVELDKNPKTIARINDKIDYSLEEFDEVFDGYVTLDKGNIADTNAFKIGKVTIQDLSSIETIKKDDFTGKLIILDACCAPGTKSTAIAEKMSSDCELYINDINENKKSRIVENFERTNSLYKELTFMPAQELKNHYRQKKFDVILVDVPCSGLGVLKRKPEIKYNIKPTDLDDLQKIQKEILESMVELLSDQGTLIYSTCTLNKKENEKNLISENFDVIEQVTILPDEYHDGFFHAKLRKKNEISNTKS